MSLLEIFFPKKNKPTETIGEPPIDAFDPHLRADKYLLPRLISLLTINPSRASVILEEQDQDMVYQGVHIPDWRSGRGTFCDMLMVLAIKSGKVIGGIDYLINRTDNSCNPTLAVLEPGRGIGSKLMELAMQVLPHAVIGEMRHVITDHNALDLEGATDPVLLDERERWKHIFGNAPPTISPALQDTPHPIVKDPQEGWDRIQAACRNTVNQKS